MPTRARSSTTSILGSWMSIASSMIEPVTRAIGMVSFIRLMQRRKVDLPQPDGPISAVTWFCGMSRSTPKSACFSP